MATWDTASQKQEASQSKRTRKPSPSPWHRKKQKQASKQAISNPKAMACPEAQTQQSKQAAPELQGASKQVAPEIRCTWKDSHSHSSAQPSNAAKGASCHEEPSWDALSALEEDRKNQLRWQNAEVLQGGKGNYGLGWTGAAELCLCSIL